MRRDVVLFIAFISIVLIVYFSSVSRQNKDDEYLQKLNLSLIGILKDSPDCSSGDHGFCIMNINVLQSNTKEYDPRNNKKTNYIGIIKNKQAQIYLQGLHDCKEGDTVMIDTKKEIITCGGFKYDITVSPDFYFYEYANKHHPF